MVSTGKVLPICWDGAGAQEATHKPHSGGFGGAATPVLVPALLAAAGCAAPCAHVVHTKGREASEGGCCRSCSLTFCTEKHFEMFLFLFVTQRAMVSAASPVSRAWRRHSSSWHQPTATTRWRPARLYGSQNGARARGGSWTLKPGLSPPVSMSIFACSTGRLPLCR